MVRSRLARCLTTFVVTWAAILAAEICLAEYDPLAVPSGFKAETVDFTIDDAARKREIPIRVYLPKPSGDGKPHRRHPTGGKRPPRERARRLVCGAPNALISVLVHQG